MVAACEAAVDRIKPTAHQPEIVAIQDVRLSQWSGRGEDLDDREIVWELGLSFIIGNWKWETKEWPNPNHRIAIGIYTRVKIHIRDTTQTQIRRQNSRPG